MKRPCTVRIWSDNSDNLADRIKPISRDIPYRVGLGVRIANGIVKKRRERRQNRPRRPE